MRRGGQATAAAAFLSGVPNLTAEAAEGNDSEVFKTYEEWRRLEKAASDADTEAELRHIPPYRDCYLHIPRAGR